MSSQLGPSWSLRSTASPRCLTAYVTTTATDSISGGGIGGSSNPFDDRQTYNNNNNYNRDDNSGYIYSVAFGTERGSLHYRNYPPTETLSSTLTSGGGRIGGGRSDLSTRGQSRIGDTSQLFIDPITTNTEYGQLNLQGAVKGSIVGIVHATSSSLSSSSVVSSSGANTNTNHNNTTPVFLLLVDDNRTKPPTQSSSNSNGAYAAHLITIKNGSFHKLPAAPTSSSNLVTDRGVNMGSSKPPQHTSGHTHRRGGSGPGSSSGSGI